MDQKRNKLEKLVELNEQVYTLLRKAVDEYGNSLPDKLPKAKEIGNDLADSTNFIDEVNWTRVCDSEVTKRILIIEHWLAYLKEHRAGVIEKAERGHQKKVFDTVGAGVVIVIIAIIGIFSYFS